MIRKLRKLALAAVSGSPLEHALRTALVRLSSGQNDRYDRELDRLMTQALRRDSNCVDVGAYRGEVLRRIVQLAPDGTHFAFEPVRGNYEHLVRTVPAARVFNLALSDYCGQSTFEHVLDRPARSGLLKVEYPDPDQEVREVNVEVSTLDSVVPAEVRIDFLKIDVEGAEFAVLCGGRQLLSRYRPIVIFEHGYEKARAYGATPEQIHDLLAEELGLKVSLMQRWLHGDAAFTRDEFCRLVYQKQEFCFVAYPQDHTASSS